MELLAALLGQIVGLSLSPEVWIAGVVIGFARKNWVLSVTFALAASACIQILVASLRMEYIGRFEYNFVQVFVRAIPILLIAAVVKAVRSASSSKAVVENTPMAAEDTDKAKT
jgi:hypothetical protein